ncbi:MAG: 30S ribosomal protein S12 methylthiotransferase RimO [Prevotella sp.]|jgi:ribosomal protein S12 methylthiotransferase|nr:30S ribosomal protein S12 methylthiotransferase RimO [Prevotella sp.]MBR1620595.1 30S ribosomal protein S12 methylthiotransferase RimO [Prevotella sp.]
MKENQIDIITLGCSKNLVDSERLIRKLEGNGYHCTHDTKRPNGDIAIINTCGFIGDAKEESINTILEFVQAKEEGRLKKLLVMGCLSQRYKNDLVKEIPQVDKYYGKFDFKQVVEDLGKAKSSVKSAPAKLTPHHYAYIKISEGCNRHCAYCAIPIITGSHKSRSMDDILDEIRRYVDNGVYEFQIIAQELTYYGIDFDGKSHIAELIEKISDIKGVKWIRLHYAYPTDFPYDLLRVIRERDNVCKYLDIAFQHISDNILNSMHRHFSKNETYELIRRIREEVPGITLRTTLMVGFPNETDTDFEELLEFTRWARFERMGAFAYSEEEDTFSQRHYDDNVPDNIKQSRLDKLMAIQQEISAEIEASKIGKIFKVVIDRKEGNYYIGRTEFSSPEVDPEVLIPVGEKTLRVGRFYNIKITDAEEFDLYGVVEEK